MRIEPWIIIKDGIGRLWRFKATGKADSRFFVNKFTKIYLGGEPDFEEGDVFCLMVPLQDIISNTKENEGTEWISY